MFALIPQLKHVDFPLTMLRAEIEKQDRIINLVSRNKELEEKQMQLFARLTEVENVVKALYEIRQTEEAEPTEEMLKASKQHISEEAKREHVEWLKELEKKRRFKREGYAT